MSDPTYRAFTLEERARLSAELAHAQENPVSVPQALAAAASVLGAYLWRSLIGLNVLALLALAVLPGWLATLLARAAGGAVLLGASTVALLVITANRSWMSFLTRLARGVERDLTAGQVRVRAYRPLAAVTLKLDAGAVQGHLLELDGSLLVFVPASLSQDAAPFPAERVELAVAPESQVFVSARGDGPALAAPERTPLATALARVLARPCEPVPGTLAGLPEARREELS